MCMTRFYGVSDQLVLYIEMRVTSWEYNDALSNKNSHSFVEKANDTCSIVQEILKANANYTTGYLACEVTAME